MVLEKIKTILSEQFSVEEKDIKPETLLEDDLGADSLDVVDLLMTIEDDFEVEIPDEEVENIKTVGALVEYIESHSQDCAQLLARGRASARAFFHASDQRRPIRQDSTLSCSVWYA